MVFHDKSLSLRLILLNINSFQKFYSLGKFYRTEEISRANNSQGHFVSHKKVSDSIGNAYPDHTPLPTVGVVVWLCKKFDKKNE